MDQFDEPQEEQFDDQVEQPEEPQPESLVRIRYAGNTYEVPESLADVWTKREEEFQRKLSAQSTELGQLRQQRQAPAPAPASEQDEDLEFFQSPSQAIRKRTQSLREELKQELRQELELEQKRQEYWSQFYNTHKDLRERKSLVTYVVKEHFEDLKDLAPAASQREIARIVRETLGVQEESGTRLSNRPVSNDRVSQGQARQRPREEESEVPKLTGISAELAERAERRRRAHYNIPKEEK